MLRVSLTARYALLKAPLLREEPEVRFRFVAEHRYLYPVRVLCSVMRVSRSGFYDYLTCARTGPSKREREDAVLREQIGAIFEESGKRYGSPRVHAELRTGDRPSADPPLAVTCASCGLLFEAGQEAEN